MTPLRRRVHLARGPGAGATLIALAQDHWCRVVPAALPADDPTPERDVVFVMQASESTGRRSVAGAR